MKLEAEIVVDDVLQLALLVSVCSCPSFAVWAFGVRDGALCACCGIADCAMRYVVIIGARSV